MNRPSAYPWLHLALLGLAFVLFMLPLPHGWSVGWRGELTNRMHAPLMSLCLVFVTSLISRFWAKPLLPAIIGTMAMAAVVEGVQPCFGRTASWEDFIWSTVGVLGGVLGCSAGRWSSAAMRKAAWLLALTFALGPPVAWWVQIHRVQMEAHRFLPVLIDEAHMHLSALWEIDSPASHGQNAGPLLLARDASHPASIHLDTLEHDWNEYAGLEISGTLTADAPVEVGIRVDLDETRSKCLRTGGSMQPGTGHVQIFWPAGTATPRVHQLVVFLAASPARARLQIRQLRLIPVAATSAPSSSTSASSNTKKTLPVGLQETGITQ